MSERSSGWSREFGEPVVVADGSKLVTLRDAANYITPFRKGIRLARMAGSDRQLRGFALFDPAQ
jgi:hypothetical protein